MLQDLHLIADYFDQPYATLYEEDLVRRYGRQEVSAAIHSGVIQHRWVPCGQGDHRCVCWVSR